MKSGTDLCAIGWRIFGYKWPTLQELHTHMFKRGFTGAHDAMTDVRVLVRCFIRDYRNLYHTIQPVLEEAVGFLDFSQWETMGDERGGIDLSGLDQTEDFFAVATINATGLEREVLSVHIGKRERLRLIIEGNDCHDCIRSGTFPCFICRSLEQMLPIVTRTIASVGSTNSGLGFSTKANFPFPMYVYAFICLSIFENHF